MSEERLCALDELEPLEPTRFDVGTRRICVVRLDDAVYAIGDTCSHAEVSLSDGEVDPDTKQIECWKHGSCFSLVTGHPDSLPATRPVPTYTTHVRDGNVYLET